MLPPALQARIVREVAKSAWLVRLDTLAHMHPAFRAAYGSRLTGRLTAMVRAGQQLLPSGKIVPALLALLHRQMTGHALVSAPNALWVCCIYCTLRRDGHVREGDKPKQLRCPPHAPRLVTACFYPSREWPAEFFEEFRFNGKLQMMHDG
jgi:hypothetical protein